MSAASARRHAQETQRRAADPDASAWVSASAGSGKTRVLIERVLRLLLAGTPPQKILCLTFTNAAAAEMANRLSERLGAWAVADEPALAAELQALTGATPAAGDPAFRLARTLFANVLDAPGGIRIHTIHAFCQSVLRRFPLEAGLPANFSVLDTRDAAQLAMQARRAVFHRAEAAPGPGAALREALRILTAHVDEERLGDLLARDQLRLRLRDLVEDDADIDRTEAALSARLGVAPDATAEALAAAAGAVGAFDELGLRRAADAMLQGGKTDRKHGRVIADWLADPDARAAALDVYMKVFFTDKGEVRSKLIHSEAQKLAPGAEAVLAREAARLEAVREGMRAATTRAATAALVRLATAIEGHYRALKRQAAALDYDDLIARTLDLLQDPGLAEWVLYKLDGGIAHILIDEAQDTSPRQWRIVERLSREFFAGEGAQPGGRTVFAVGDTKQSIYSFQGAEPQAFEEMKRYFEERAQAAQQGWRQVTLDTSFRSTEPLLRSIDRVFHDTAARDGLMFLDDAWVPHQAIRATEAGLVELWPLSPKAASDEDEETEGGRLLPSAERTVAASTRLAERIAETIDDWRSAGAMLEARGRPIRPGDVLILVRRRGAFVEDMVRALKARHIPVAGVDRMVLTDQLAVMDLMALGRFLLLPEDDLSLAETLKSPLFDFGDDDLFAVAHGRGGASLWRSLRERAVGDARLAGARDTLAALLDRADFVPPYELYAEVLGPLGGRRRMLARLGPDAEDPIDEFMTLALHYGRRHPPSLQGFLHWLTAGRTEIKRDLDQGGPDEVRVMTVHGAKGLEAPVVFLPDTTSLFGAGRGPEILWTADDAPLPVWAGRKSEDAVLTAALRRAAEARQAQEHRRLLYVAMTRAMDRLYVCGWEPKNKAPDGCWYNLVRRGLDGVAERLAMDLGDGWAGEGLRLSGGRPAARKDQPEAEEQAAPEPAWLRRPAPAEPVPPRPLAPSRPDDAEPAVFSPRERDRAASRFQRGRLIHRLLQTLPALPADARAHAARRYLARKVHALPESAQAAYAAEVMAVLDDPATAPLFGPRSMAEVPVTGLVGARVVSAQIDRLYVGDDAVVVLDFKTNRPPPTRPEDTPTAYLRQMATYRAILRQIYPETAVSCALLWTDGPLTMALDDALMEAHAP